MNRSRWVALGLALSLSTAALVVLLILPGAGSAQSTETGAGQVLLPPSLTQAGDTARTLPLLALADVGPMSVSGSSVSTEHCYEPAHSQTLCFTVYNGSTDAEWLDEIRLTFPSALGAWDVSCKSQDATDSSGSPVHLACSKSFANELRYVDNDLEVPNSIGEISAGSSWGLCVDANIPAGYNGPRLLNWQLSGDEEPGSALPHQISGTLAIEQCMPLMLKPTSMLIEGCSSVAQTHTLELWNNTGGAGTFNLTYVVPSNNATFTGPGSVSLAAGEVVTLAVELKPDLCQEAGAQVTAVLQVAGNGQSDESTLVQTITSLAGWGTRASSPVPSMDSVVVWASYADGGLWAIGGYGAHGATQRYDPGTDTWTTHTSEATITPTIEYPMDGCYGLNGADDEVVILFPDTIVTGSLHTYNITHDTWYTETVPGFYPPGGRWAQDVVSLFNNPSVRSSVEKNACYMSGGADRPGGGTTRDLWVYYPGTNSGGYVGAFPAAVWFDFHASWYVPWVGSQGAICVGGGIDHKSQINASTQCYDLETGTFGGLNADLGPLPEPWWGMADGWQVQDGQYQIWIANGVNQTGRLFPASAYAGATSGAFVPGPGLPASLYRLEGDGWDGQFYLYLPQPTARPVPGVLPGLSADRAQGPRPLASG
jgi:hypothetical protein